MHRDTSPINILNNRPQSPFARSAFPGAVLLSPQSVSARSPPSNMTINHPSSPFDNHSASNLQGNIPTTASVMSFDDILDRVSYTNNNSNTTSNIPSIQHPIPLSSTTSSSPTPTYFNNNGNNINNFNNNNLNIINNSNSTQPSLHQYLNTPPPPPIIPNEPTTTTYLDTSTTNKFSQDIARVTHWTQNLSVQQQIVLIDNLLPILNDSVLNYTRSRLDPIIPQHNQLLNLDSLLINDMRPKSVDPTMMKSGGSVNSNNSNVKSVNTSMTRENLTDPKLLNDLPSWLKSLRLHKYSNCFVNMSWQAMIILTEPELEARGVTALGARRKLLKAFNIVKDAKDQGLIDKSAF